MLFLALEKLTTNLYIGIILVNEEGCYISQSFEIDKLPFQEQVKQTSVVLN